MDLSDGERELLLSGLVALVVDLDEDDATRQQCRALASKLGGDFDALLGAEAARAALETVERLPDLADDADGIYYPHPMHVDEEGLAQAKLAGLFADCVANGRHHLATLDHPEAGMVVGCTHCHRYWRARDPV